MPRSHVIVPDSLGGKVVLVVQQLTREHLVSGLLGVGQPLTAVSVDEEVNSTVPVGGTKGLTEEVNSTVPVRRSKRVNCTAFKHSNLINKV